jgi:iron complex transport system ATP-binding protein
MSPILELEHVFIRRGSRMALHDVSLRVEQGEHVAILGPNGCGKSTLIQTIHRDLYPQPFEGTVCRLFGEERWDVSQLRTRLGIVSNDLQEFYRQDITGLVVVVSGFFRSIGLWPAQDVTPAMWAKAEEVLDKLGLSRLADRSVLEMSSGEARRLLVGRALIHNPKALLFDEPTNSLDFRAAHEFRENVSELARTGHTILMVTHTVQDIVPEIERVVMLKDGHVFRDGPKQEVLTAPVLTELFGRPLKVVEAEGQYLVW